MDLHLADRAVLVTGGSSGVGLASLRLLHAEGALLGTCARDRARLEATLAETGIVGERVVAIGADVRDPEAMAALVTQVAQRFGRLDGLVNNAGQARMKGLADATMDDWHDEFDLKLGGVLNPTNAALSLLRAAPAASVVNVNAVLAVQPEARLVTTSAARAGLLNLSRSMADEYASDGIRVNSVCLGIIDTGQWRRRYEQSDRSVDWDTYERRLAQDRGVPLGRLGRPDEVASLIAFLLSDRASYLTGSAFDVGGGVNRAMH